uniref:Uncharacterized protein n=1 Tax=Setaria italica TaxID=4555 RepID=K4ANF7_SETIT
MVFLLSIMYLQLQILKASSLFFFGGTKLR